MKTIALKENLNRFWYIFLLPPLAIIFFIIATKIVNPVEYPNSDFFTFWLSGRLASLGQNPYNSQIWITGHHQFGASWIPDATFIYPLPISLLFIPLGLLPLYQAFIAWNTLSQLMIVSSIALLLMTNSNLSTKRFIFPLLVGVILFRPTIITLVNGQLSGMLLLLIACTMYLWERGKWGQGAALLAFLALKPNLGIPLIVLLSVYLIQQKQITSLIAEAVSGLLLLLAGFVQNPNWLIEFWNAGNTKLSQTFGFSPTIWGMSAFFCNYNLNCTVGYGVCMGLLFLIGYLYLLARKKNILSSALVVSLAIAITLLLTPYIWPYDQLLLVAPIVTMTIMLAKDGYGYLPASLLFLTIDILALILLGISGKIQMEIWNVSIPLLIFGLLIWYIWRNKPISRVADAA
jgi:glycosyl transferase family 87